TVDVLKVFLVLTALIVLSCKPKNDTKLVEQTSHENPLSYASGFSIERFSDFTLIEVNSPWPGAEKTYTYALVPKEKLAVITLPKEKYDAIIATPVDRIVATATTHVAALEQLGVLDKLVGFPNTDYISSPQARKMIAAGNVKDLGANEMLNTEMVLQLQPDLVMGFAINASNKSYQTLENAGIPVVLNGDWTEQTPLGKAEWIRFFAPFFHKDSLANKHFGTIEADYNEAKKLAEDTKNVPTVLIGGLFKDVWYVSGGKSWMAQFLSDAHTNYLWSDTEETGGIGLSVESVLAKGQSADFWFNPSMHKSYDEMEAASPHYERFKAFQNRKVFSNSMKTGETGGTLFFEEGPLRPDLVLKDLISILHPEILENHTLQFFGPID
ncbi:MAG: ABC transporter substrate-binding protein, partial [Bacteroidota bacterium]